MIEVEILKDTVAAWQSKVEDRDAFLRWDAKHDHWTVSARDGRSGKVFAISGQPAGLISHFASWDQSL